MKKNLKKLAVLVLTVILALSAFVGCGEIKWTDKVTLKNPGAVKEETNGGFLVETENYVYFINGQADSSLDNTYGKAVKGALMVCEKKDLSSKDLASVKAEIVVPKLLVSTEYDAGISIYGDTVYFVSPSVQKTTSNKVASDYVDLCSAKLDGSGITIYTTVASSSLQYRIVKSGNDVFFVYVDASTDKIYSYNTSNKTNTLVAEEYTSFFFNENATTKDVAVFYTTEEEKAYSTEKYSYNIVYGYNVTTGAKKVLDGSTTKQLQYTLIQSQNGYLYYSVLDNSISDTDLQTSYYAMTIESVLSEQQIITKLNSKSSTYIVDTTEFVTPNEVYYIETISDSDEDSSATGYVVCDDLTTEIASKNKQIIAEGAPTTIVSISNDAIYYIDSNGNMLRYNRLESRQETVTEDTVLSDWYKPEFVTYQSDTFVFYVNTSSEGCNYVNFMSTNSAVSEKEDEEENTLYYIKKSYEENGVVKYNQRLAGTVSESDQTLIVTSLIAKLDGEIVFDVDDDDNIKLVNGQPTCEMVEVVSTRYFALTDSQRKNLDSEDIQTLANYQEAYRISKMLYKLFGFDDVTKNKDSFKADYETVKPIIEDLRVRGANDDTNATTILSKLVANGRWYLQQCEKYFNA